MVDDVTALVVILAMGVVTLVTRLGGVFIMSVVPITPRVEAFLRYMSSSVLVAIVVPAALKGDAGVFAAVAVATVAIVALRNGVVAVVVGTAVAAGLRALALG